MEFRKIRESESDKGISNSSITRGLNYTGTAVRWSSYYTDRLKENPKMLYTVLFFPHNLHSSINAIKTKGKARVPEKHSRNDK